MQTIEEQIKGLQNAHLAMTAWISDLGKIIGEQQTVINSLQTWILIQQNLNDLKGQED